MPDEATVDAVWRGDARWRGESGGVAESLLSLSVSSSLDSIESECVIGVVM